MRKMNYYSDASVLELSMMYSDGLLEMPKTPRQWVNEQIKPGTKVTRHYQEICYRLAETPAYHPGATTASLFPPY